MVKNPTANTGDAKDVGLIPGSGRPPGVGNGKPLQYSCMGNPMDRGAWRATSPWGHKESDTSEHSTCTLLSSLYAKLGMLQNSEQDRQRTVLRACSVASSGLEPPFIQSVY